MSVTGKSLRSLGFKERILEPRLVGAIILALGVSVSASDRSTVWAQDEGADMKPLVTLTKTPEVQKAKKGKGWTIKVLGKARPCPAKTKIIFVLTWRAQSIEEYNYVLPGNKLISAEFTVKEAPISVEPMMFRTEIHLNQQPSDVKKFIQKNEEDFHPALNPWTDYHMQQKFVLASQEEIDAHLADIRVYFTENYTTLALLNREVADRAKEGEEGEFNARKWRKFMDDDVLKKVAKIQKDIRSKYTENKFMQFRMTLGKLEEVANGVANRATRKSMDLYKKHGLPVSKADQEPKNVNTKTRRRPPIRNAYLKRQIELIDQDLGIATEEQTDQKEGS